MKIIYFLFSIFRYEKTPDILICIIDSLVYASKIHIKVEKNCEKKYIYLMQMLIGLYFSFAKNVFATDQK